MADKRISDLVAATGVNPSDLFVLEQSGTAKKLTGQILETWLLQLAQGHGGITGIQKVGTAVLVDTYRITFSDATTFDFTVSNGRGITDITWTTSGTSGNGQLHKGTITYNDGTTQTINIRDGYKGNPGADGASAYQQAVAGGYSGTEAQFNDALANFEDYYIQTVENKNTAVTAAGQASASASSAQVSMDVSQNYANRSATSAAQSEQSARNSASNAAASIGSYYRKEVSGEYVHFTDGADNVPMVSVEVDLQPRLETNGYDSVWPAGGGVNIVDLSDQEISSSDYSAITYVTIPNTGSFETWRITFDAVNNSGSAGSVVLSPYASGDRTQVITVNVPDGTDGKVTGTGFMVESGDTLFICVKGNFYMSRFALGRSNDVIEYSPYENKGTIPPWQTFTENVSKTWVSPHTLPSGVVQYSVDFTSGDLFYGGTVDITNGTVTAEFASKAFLGIEGWAKYGTTGNIYYLNLTDGPFGDVSVQFDGQNLSNYLTWADSATWDGKNIVRFEETSSRRLYVINPTFASNLTEFTDYLARNPLKICYKVETPTSASFQGQQINSFLGENYVWATLGSHAIGTTSVVYRVDMTMQIDALEASVAEQAQIATEAAESVSASAAQIETNRQDIAVLQEDVLKLYPIGKASGAVASFTDGADGAPMKSLKVNMEPIQDLHGYGNPWVGGSWTNKYNVAANPFEQGNINGSNGQDYSSTASNAYRLRSTGYIPVEPGQTYTISANLPYIYLYYYASDNSYLGNIGDWMESPHTFTVANDVSFVRICLAKSAATSGSGAIAVTPSDFEWMQIEEGSTATTPWTPYENICPISGRDGADVAVNSATYTVPFDETVYGGTVDAVQGTLSDEYRFMTLDGTESWTRSSSSGVYFFRIVLGTPTSKPENRCVPDTGISSHFPKRDDGVINHEIGIRVSGESTSYCYIRYNMDEFDTATKFKAWLAEQYANGTPVQICYKLRTPKSYTVNAQEIATLYGDNTVMSNDGDVEMEYRADPTLYIDKRLSAVKAIIAGVESDYTATQNYAIGDYIVVGDGLYRVTAAIASGETINPGTNCTETTVAEQLKALYTLVNS